MRYFYKTAMSLATGKRSVRSALIALIYLFTFTEAYAAIQSPQPLKAGAAKVDISPDLSTSKDKYLLDPLFVRTLFIQGADTCAALIEVDKAVVLSSLVSTVRKELSQCPEQHIQIWATHTHSADDLPFDPAKIENETGGLVKKIVESVNLAAKNTVPVSMLFGKTDLYLNTNRDLYNGHFWYQGPNERGPSDKTLSVISFINSGGQPVGLVMNYGMHPISYFLSGAISSDFPGAASSYIENIYPGSVALFSQAASGDQNPLLSRPLGKLIGMHSSTTKLSPDDRVGQKGFWLRFAEKARENVSIEQDKKQNTDPVFTTQQKREVVDEVKRLTDATGTMLGEMAINVMHSSTEIFRSGDKIVADNEVVTCPGRDRVDQKIREGFDPGYVDGEDVKLNVSLLRIGNLAMLGIDSEIYTDIVNEIKVTSPLTNTMVTGLANGLANSGYVYSDNAAHSQVFQVIGSRLKPGCAEDKIVDATKRLIYRSM